jgi:glycosyltransferase involved in cell wall biosynthesis
VTVSVIIAAHPARARNGMLAEATMSVCSQTQPPDALHVIIDHDGLGAPATRQRALDHVDTEWVAFLDSDDVFMPRHLELLTAHAVKTGADYVYSWFRIIQQFGNGARKEIMWTPEDGDGVFPPGHYLNEFDPNDPIETTITVLVRTELAKQVGFRPLDRGQINTGEDRAFTLDCLAAGAKIVHLRRFTWWWRHHWLPGGGKGNTSGHANQGDAEGSAVRAGDA